MRVDTRNRGNTATQSLGGAMLKTTAWWDVERMGTCRERRSGDTPIRALVGGAGDIDHCDYRRSLCVSVADTAAVGKLIRAAVLRAHGNIDDPGIPHDAESGSYVSDFVCLEDVFAGNDAFSELVVDAGGNERLSRDLMSDSAPNAADGYIDEPDNGLAHLVEINARVDPGAE